MKTLAAAAALAMTLGSAGLAHATGASLILNFTLDGSTGGLGVGPFGTVVITEDTIHTGWLDFTVTPGANWDFHKTQNNGHEAFYFDLTGDPSISIMNLSSGFSVGPTNVNSPPFNSSWDYSISVAANNHGPLTFQVKKNDATALKIADLGYQIYNTTHKVRAAADLTYTDPKTKKAETGNAGAELAQAPGVPEPATWTMLIMGFGLTGSLLRRRAIA